MLTEMTVLNQKTNMGPKARREREKEHHAAGETETAIGEPNEKASRPLSEWMLTRTVREIADALMSTG